MRAAISAEQAAALVPDGASVMVGGFLAVGSPDRIIDALVARFARGLTVIGSDTARPGLGIGKLVDAGGVARAVVSHIGTNPVTQKKMFAGEIAVDLVPQGTLAERIRAAGAGLGGVLTPTGVGTEAAEGRQGRELEHGTYLLEPPLRADVADPYARGRPFLQPDLPADRRELQPSDGHGRGLRRRGGRRDRADRRHPARCRADIRRAGGSSGGAAAMTDPREFIARRVALELHHRTLVNLGIGLPTLVARFVPPGIRVAFQSENGIIGIGAPPDGMEDPNLTDAGGAYIGALPGVCSFDSAMSFAFIGAGISI
jgi:3-oxoacid CoA-transferase A subunit